MQKTKLLSFSRQHWFLTLGFIVSLAFAVWYAYAFLADAIYFNDPRHKDQALKGWMTPRYVVMSYDLPKETVRDALGLIPNDRDRPIRLSVIAERQKLSLDELTDKVRAAAKAYRESQND